MIINEDTKRMRSLVLALILVILGGAIAYAFYNTTVLAPTSPVPSSSPTPIPSASTPSGTMSPLPTSSASATPAASSLVLTSPKQGSRVSSPLTITGQATGNWYFEGSFPIELVDAQGTLLAKGIATAQGEWMTTELVPFTATLTFSKPSTSTGTLILKKDNPSGLPENDAEQRIGVSF